MCEYPGRSRKRKRVDIIESGRSNNELREVSRSHSTIKKKKWEGPNNRKSEERTKGGQCVESRIS